MGKHKNYGYSQRRRTLIRQAKLETPQQMAYADLTALGWIPTDIILVLGLADGELETANSLESKALRFADSQELDKQISKRKKQLKGGIVLGDSQNIHPTPGSRSDGRGRPSKQEKTPKELIEEPPADDSEVLHAMWDTIQKLDVKDPQRAKLLEIYDKTKRRQGQTSDDETTIHFYLPRPECDNCPMRGERKPIITEPTQKTAENTSEITDGTPPPPPKKKRGRPKKEKAETTESVPPLKAETPVIEIILDPPTLLNYKK